MGVINKVRMGSTGEENLEFFFSTVKVCGSTYYISTNLLSDQVEGRSSKPGLKDL